MLVGVIQETSLAGIAQQLATLPPHFDLLELRLDACTQLDVAALGALALPLPVLFTLRPCEQGGAYAGSEAQRLHTLLALARLQPAFLDVEYTVPPDWLARIREAAPRTQLIVSCHDFTHTPSDLEAMLRTLHRAVPDAICKMATLAHSTLDALRMLAFCKQHHGPLIGICMGEAGASTRILAPLVHTGLCYCPVAGASAPGQIDAQTLCDIYRFKSLSPSTRLYGLLGDPVSKSVGHCFHNRLNGREERDAVYVKWRITPDELPDAVPLLKALDVAGLSLTMPLKEHILPLLDELDAEAAAIGAVNTVVVRHGRWTGYNTDAPGAVEALPCRVAGSRFMVLGAGGAARAIVHELVRCGAVVTVLNRTLEHAALLGVPVLALNRVQDLAREGYDAIINTLPSGAALPLGPDTFCPGAVAMDISYINDGTFLHAAAAAGCVCIDGLKMFEKQGALQRALWG